MSRSGARSVLARLEGGAIAVPSCGAFSPSSWPRSPWRLPPAPTRSRTRCRAPAALRGHPDHAGRLPPDRRVADALRPLETRASSPSRSRTTCAGTTIRPIRRRSSATAKRCAYQPDLKQVIKAPLGQAFQVEHAGDLPRRARAPRARLRRQPGAQRAERWVLKLVPKKRCGLGTLELGVRKSDAGVAEARITDSAGTTTRRRVLRRAAQRKLEPVSSLHAPPGVDVVKPRLTDARPMPSFDVVCELDLQEVDNAINQTQRELGKRFDFKGTHRGPPRGQRSSSAQRRLQGARAGRHPAGEARKAERAAEGDHASEPRARADGQREAEARPPAGHPPRRRARSSSSSRTPSSRCRPRSRASRCASPGKKRDDLQAVMQLLRERRPRHRDAVHELPRLSAPWPRRVHFLTLGCPKNQVDSEVMLGMLARAGTSSSSIPTRPTCSSSTPAASSGRPRRSRSTPILDAARVKAARAGRRLVVTGCLAQRYADDLVRELPEVDAFVGTGDLLRIAEAVEAPPARRARRLSRARSTCCPRTARAARPHRCAGGRRT